ncbi:MAG: hypothetical protein O7D86_05895 [Proteobacteria bacterium]|nr:hypothetical protein [Pseudomonadota bacterium]
MTTRDCTAISADLKNTAYLYPVISSSKPLHVAEDSDDDYDAVPKTDEAMMLSCKKLKTHLEQRLKHQNTLPIRIHVLLDDLYPLLRQHKQIDVFDLLVELILYADIDPARCLSALLAVLDDEALINLERNTVANTGAFLHDVLQRDSVRWQLEAYHDMQEKEEEKKR